MAMTTSLGYTDSVTTQKTLSIPDLSYAKDFAVTRDTPDEVVITNTTSPIDQPETIRFGYTTVADVYRNTGIDPSVAAVSKRGASIVIQLNDILRVSCGSETSCSPVQFDLPISTHIVVKVPINQYITADLVKQEVLRNVAALFGTGEVTSARIDSLLRHALQPTGM